MCSIAFRHASGEVPLDHERKMLITHLFPDKSESREEDARTVNVGLISGEKLLSCIKRTCVSLGQIHISLALRQFTFFFFFKYRISCIKLVQDQSNHCKELIF